MEGAEIWRVVAAIEAEPSLAATGRAAEALLVRDVRPRRLAQDNAFDDPVLQLAAAADSAQLRARDRPATGSICTCPALSHTLDRRVHVALCGNRDLVLPRLLLEVDRA